MAAKWCPKTTHFVGWYIIFSVVLGHRSSGTLVIKDEDLGHQPTAVEAIRNCEGAKPGHHQPEGVDALAPVQGGNGYRESAQGGDASPDEDSTKFQTRHGAETTWRIRGVQGGNRTTPVRTLEKPMAWIGLRADRNSGFASPPSRSACWQGPARTVGKSLALRESLWPQSDYPEPSAAPMTPNRASRARLLYLLFVSGWDISNANGDQKITLGNIEKKIIESDAFVFTPGATLEDMFKAISIFVGFQTLDGNLAGKPAIILNEDSSWNPFFAVLSHLRQMGTLKQNHSEFLHTVSSPEAVLGGLGPDQS